MIDLVALAKKISDLLISPTVKRIILRLILSFKEFFNASTLPCESALMMAANFFSTTGTLRTSSRVKGTEAVDCSGSVVVDVLLTGCWVIKLPTSGMSLKPKISKGLEGKT